MEKEAVRERIRFLTEYIKVLWVMIMATSGGLVSLFFSLDEPEKVVIFSMGLLVLSGLIVAVVKLIFDANELLEKLEEGG